MIYAAYALSFAAIVVMAIDVFLAFKLKRAILGGEVGKKWTLLTTLLVVFFLCYLLSPLVLVLDLGQPSRLIVAMTTYNFKSIFAWNIFLYVGFLVVVAAYLWLQMERRMNRFAAPAGMLAFLWRLILTTGTGCIFGFLVARQFYDAAMMIPLFIVLSLVLGTAAFILVSMALGRWFEDGPDCLEFRNCAQVTDREFLL